MRKKFSFYSVIFIILFFFSNNSFAKPRCEVLYENVYNDKNRKDVNLRYIENKKTIGIRLKKIPDKNKNKFILDTNKDGFYKVGKITKGELSNLIFLDDVILSINNKDLRKFDLDASKLYNQFDISDFFEKNELIRFKILRFNPKTNKDYIVIIDKSINSSEPDIYNTIENFNEPSSDFYVKSIKVNEKDGDFDATIHTDYYQPLDKRYFLANQMWKDLIYDKKFDDENYLQNFWYETCTFSD